VRICETGSLWLLEHDNKETKQINFLAPFIIYEGFHDFYSSLCIVGIIKPRRVLWTRHVARMEEETIEVATKFGRKS
jgi:hypothetical protein